MAVAEEGGDGAVERARSRRVVSDDVELVIVEDATEVADVVAERLAHAARAGGHIIWWSDERCVPPEDDLSNYALAKRTLLDRLERAPRAVHRIKGELGKERAAADYERELGYTVFDLELLGIGKDGHVASLFPNAPTLHERKRVLPAAPGLEPFVDRVTLSIPALNSAREIVFAVSGAEKADAARRAFASKPGPETPASLVRAGNGRTIAILDRAAAAELRA